MSRREEIKKASNELSNSCSKTFRMGFEVGAMWADNNPKTLWINIEDDLPCNYSNNIHFGYTDRVLATDGKINIFIAYMKNINNKWVWYSDDNFDVSHVVTHWMPLPKPPKEYFEIK